VVELLVAQATFSPRPIWAPPAAATVSNGRRRLLVQGYAEMQRKRT
jgi:hypothetical protein